jgi:hypothetical protein
VVEDSGGSFTSCGRYRGRESLKAGWRGAVKAGGGARLL